MKLLFTMFGINEMLLPIIVLVLLAAISWRWVKYNGKKRTLKKQLDEVTKDRNELRDKLII